MEETTYICERCGERVPADACTMVADTILCPDCVDMYTTVCDCCGERLFLSDDHGDENITLCERCYERHYTHCERCGRVISYSDAYYEDDDEDEPLCYNCLQARLQQATIHDYSYTPRLIFHGERSNERFFGVELEIDGNGKSRKNAGEILNVANEDAQNLYIKSDGSLDCGMELVTHPMTLQYHIEQMPVEKCPAQGGRTRISQPSYHDLRTARPHLSCSLRRNRAGAGIVHCSTFVLCRKVLD